MPHNPLNFISDEKMETSHMLDTLFLIDKNWNLIVDLKAISTSSPDLSHPDCTFCRAAISLAEHCLCLVIFPPSIYLWALYALML